MKYRSAIEYDFENQSGNFKDNMQNPTGFKVSQYKVTQIIEESKK